MTRRFLLLLLTMLSIVVSCSAQEATTDVTDAENVGQARQAFTTTSQVPVSGTDCRSCSYLCVPTGYSCKMGSASASFTGTAAPTSVAVSLSGVSCGTGTVSISVNSVPLGSFGYAGLTNCLCGGACMPMTTFWYHNRNGVPNYVANGTNAVFINDPGGGPTGGFTSVAATVTSSTDLSISPNTGPASGGTSVLITGPNLPAGTPKSILFGGFAGTNITRVDSSTIKVTAPAGTGGSTPDIVVTFPGSPAAAVMTFAGDWQYGKAASTTNLVSSVAPSVFGQSVTLTATVPNSSYSVPTGTVTFYDGANPLGSATLDSSGAATLTTSALSVASHSITAQYGGDGVYVGSTSSAIDQVVNAGDTTTTVVSSSNPSVIGGSVSFTATVAATAPAVGTPSGTVQFFDGANALGAPVTLNGSAQASLTTSALSLGGHSITAQYAASTNFKASTSSAVTQQVNQDGSTVALASSVNPSTFGDSVIFTATVTQASTGGVPTGAVTFLDGASTLGTGNLNAAGQATFTTSALTGGSHSITASYAGDTNHTGGASGALAQVVKKVASGTALVSTTNPSVFGQSVTFTATITTVNGVPATGTVTFFDGASTLGTGPLNGAGVATLSTSALSVTTHAITAQYGGDTNYATSTSAVVNQVVDQGATTTAVLSSSNPSIVGGSVTLTATVSATDPAVGTPTGTVQFFDGAAPLGAPMTLNASARADLMTSALTAGAHAITAQYAASTNFKASTSAAVSQQVNKDGASASVASSANPSTYGDGVTFTVTVASSGTGGVPTGDVQFFDGANAISEAVALDGEGKAIFQISALTGGTHAISAQYVGDANHAGVSSGAVSQLVNAASSATILASSANPSVFGQQVTFTANVTSGVAGTLTGTVEFRAGTSVLGSSALNAGVATYQTSTLAVSRYDIMAVYTSGDANYASSTSAILPQVVNSAATTTTVVASANPGVVGSAVTFTATVTATAPGAGTPSGTVTFRDGATTIGAGNVSDGQVAFTTSALSAGSHTITAEYGGDAGFAGSTSSSLTETINAFGAVASLTATPNPSTVEQPITLTATITRSASAGTGSPTGSVTFREKNADGSVTTLGAGPVGLNAGVASLVVSTLPVGSHAIVAEYSGDDLFGQTTATVTQAVDKAASVTTLTAANNPSTVGQSVVLTAKVTSAVAGATGNVDFMDGTTKMGTGALSNGTATYTANGLTQGGHSLTAVYAGDATHTTSTSTALSQTVNAAAADGGSGSGSDAGGAGNDAGLNSAGGSSSEPAAADAGCGCRTAPPTTNAAILLPLLGASLFAARIRRRRR